MTKKEQDRFFAILNKATDLLARFDSLRQEARLPDAASQAARSASFKAQLQLGIIVSNVSAAIYSTRKGRGTALPVIDPEHDAEVFSEFVDGYATANALRCCVVADAFMSAAEVLLAGAETAAQTAELLLRSDEKTLVAFVVAITDAALPTSFAGVLAGATPADFPRTRIADAAGSATT